MCGSVGITTLKLSEHQKRIQDATVPLMNHSVIYHDLHNDHNALQHKKQKFLTRPRWSRQHVRATMVNNAREKE
jgi:hypothetical protein